MATAAAPDRRGARNPFHGRRHTPEARAAIARARAGRPHAPEVRARISASVRASWEARRAVVAGVSTNVESRGAAAE